MQYYFHRLELVGGQLYLLVARKDLAGPCRTILWGDLSVQCNGQLQTLVQYTYVSVE
jgi:hypothetical protein